MLEGSFVAIVTPFKGGKIDEKSFAELIEFQILNGTHGIVPCGTTGESPTLTHREHERVIELTVEVADKRVPVIAGTGSNSTEEAVTLTQFAEKIGADAALLVVPYYNKPTQEGLYQHYKAIASNTELPLIIYNIPGRSAVNMSPATIARVAEECNNIVGVKEASGSLSQASEIISLVDDDFVILSGDDALNFPLLAIGAKGFITVTANILPAKVAALYNSFKAGDFVGAREIHYYLHQINTDLFIETNPIPVKTALALMDRVPGEFRLPLCPMQEQNINKLKETLRSYGLIP